MEFGGLMRCGYELRILRHSVLFSMVGLTTGRATTKPMVDGGLFTRGTHKCRSSLRPWGGLARENLSKVEGYLGCFYTVELAH